MSLPVVLAPFLALPPLAAGVLGAVIVGLHNAVGAWLSAAIGDSVIWSGLYERESRKA
jgi:hypothetical protein